jgi:hypothetical protein
MGKSVATSSLFVFSQGVSSTILYLFTATLCTLHIRPIWNLIHSREISGYHGIEYEDDCHLGCCEATRRNIPENISFIYLNNTKNIKAVPLHATKALGARGGIAPTHFRLGTRWGWVVSVTPRPRFLPPGKGPPGTHWTGGWVGPRAGLDTEARGEILSPFPGMEPRSSSP